MTSQIDLQRAGRRRRELEAATSMDIKLLNQVEKQSIGERQPLPEHYLRLSDDEMDARIAAAKADARRPRSSSSATTTSATKSSSSPTSSATR